jgi:hypothetical protein
MTPDAGMPAAADAAMAAEAQAAWLVDEGALIVVGEAAGGLPATARVLASGGGPAGTMRGFAWGAGARAPGFVATLEVAHVAALRPERVDLLAASGSRTALRMGRFHLDARAVAKALAAVPPDALPDLLDFLADSFATRDGDAAGRARAGRMRELLAGVLADASRPDGLVETLGSAADGGTMLEGWSFHLRQGVADLIVETDGPMRLGAAVAVFDRADLLPNATGILSYLRGPRPVDPAAIRRVHYRAGDGFFHLAVAEPRTVLAPAKTVPHLRAALARARCDSQAMRAFRRACRPRFEGRETISTFPAPVRAVVDLAVTVPDAGTFLSGWLLDPQRRVSRVVLRSADGFYARIDESWGRVQRPDVTETYRRDALLGPAIAAIPADSHRHGFVVFVPHPNAAPPAGGMWLEIVLADDGCAFLPFQALDAAHDGIAARLLSCLDPRDAAVRPIVERHLAPACVAATRRAGRGIEAGHVVPIGAARRADETPRLTVVLPIVDSAEDLDINLACLAGEPMAAAAELVLVAAGGADSALADRADRYARFYGFSGRLAMIERAATRHQALAAGARLAGGETLLFLAPDVLPRGPGWIGGLMRALRMDARAGLASPTLLYEDDSIRFAGMPLDRLGDDAGVPDGPGRFAGYPRAWITETEPAEVLAGTSECCLIPRAVFEQAGGFARDLAGGAHQDMAFGLRLRAIGRRCLWVPTVALYAVDPPALRAVPPAGVDIARLVDDWSFARTWECQRARHAAGAAP